MHKKVLDETDEKDTNHTHNEKTLKSATCVLRPETQQTFFLSLPHDLQALTILHGPSKNNITLDETHFQNLQNLIVLEIHGFPKGFGVLRLRKNLLNRLGDLRYINFQHLHLLGDRNAGNKPVPISMAQFPERNAFVEIPPYDLHKPGEETNEIPGAMQFIPAQVEEDVVPYHVYQIQQEQAGLTTFAGLKNLKFLRVSHCNIKEVNWEMFDGLEQLEYLSLENNKIPFINDFAFFGTPNLKHLTMSHNKLLNIQSFSLAGLLKLEVLDLSYNNISHLSELSLPPFPKLITADFHHNPIETILPHTFEVTNNTEQLFLGGKSAKLQISFNTFTGLKKLRKLSLGGVYLEVLEREHLKGMHGLKDLRIEGTLHELAFDAFAEVPKLQELILKNCSIQKVSMDAFYGLNFLLYLDLSHNELETLPPSLFSQQRSLKELYINNNKLTTLPEGSFLPNSAKLIRLNKNPWHCSCSMSEWLPSHINKVKVKIVDDSACQTRYDKGSMCKIHYMYQYKYDHSVSPRCITPKRYSGYSVFHLLRKYLRCFEKLAKLEKPKKMEKIKPKKHHDNRSNNTLHGGKKSSIIASLDRLPSLNTTKAVTERTEEHTLFKRSTTASDIRELSDETQSNQQQYKSTTTTSYNAKTTHSSTSETLMVKVTKNNKIELKDMANEKEKTQTPNFKLNIDLKTKKVKQSTAQKKWELKMENTKKRLNKTLENTRSQ